MQDQEIEVSYIKINNILNGTEQLTDKYEIEGVIEAMSHMSKKIDFLKELKRRRVSLIDTQIQAEEQNIEKLEEAIKNCMAKAKEKSLDFPGVGKVQIRNAKGTWTIIDEDNLRKHLESLNKFTEVSEQSWKFRKKDLNKLLDELEQNNNVSQFVNKEPAKTSLSVSYVKEEIDAPAIAPPISSYTSAPQFDALDI